VPCSDQRTPARSTPARSTPQIHLSEIVERTIQQRRNDALSVGQSETGTHRPGEVPGEVPGEFAGGSEDPFAVATEAVGQGKVASKDEGASAVGFESKVRMSEEAAEAGSEAGSEVECETAAGDRGNSIVKAVSVIEAKGIFTG
jgi:hypothetical protein